MDEVKESAGGSAAVVIEPPAGAGVPTDEPTKPAEPPAGADKPAVEGDKPKVKLPASIKPPGKPTGRFQGRISELVGQRDAAARERDELKAENARMKGVSRPGADKGAKPTAAGDKSLNPEDFENYGEYVAALTEQTIERKFAAQKSESANAAYEAHVEERRAAFNEQAAPLAAEYGDGFWEVITDPALPISEAMASAVFELDELGPYVMLYLAAHRDEALKIARMNPRAATVAIGKLWAKLDYEIKQGGDAGAAATGGGDNAGAGGGAGQPQASQSIQAAPKPTPVPVPRGAGAPAVDAAPKDTDSVDEWLRKETDRLRRKNPRAQFYGAQ